MTSIRKPVFHVGLSTLAKLIFGLLPIPVLTRTLGIEGYGAYIILTSIAGFAVIGQVGLVPATIFRLSGAKSEAEAVRTVTSSFALLSAFGLCISVLLVAFVPFLSFTFFSGPHREEMLLPLYITCGLIPAQFFRNWMMAVGAGYFRYDLQALSEVLGAGLTSLGLAALALLGVGIAGLMSWVLMSTVATALLHAILLQRVVSWRLRASAFRKSETTRLLKFGSANWAVTIGQALFGQVDRLVVGRLIGLEAAGLYGAANSVASRINTVSGAPVQVIAPGISRLKAEHKQADARAMFQKSASIVNGIALVLAVGAIFLAPLVAMILVSAPLQRQEFAMILAILCLTYGIHSMGAPGFFGAVGIGKPALSAKWVLISGVIFAVALTLMSAQFGLRGAAWANLAYALTFMVTLRVGKDLGAAVSSMVGKFSTVALTIGMAFIAARLLIVANSSWPVTVAVGSLFLAVVVPLVLRSDYRLLRGEPLQ